MICQWQSVLNVLPGWMKQNVDEHGKDYMQELRLRLGQKPILCFENKQYELSKFVSREDLNFMINTASRYSPWAYATTSKGYITIPGGHRLGLAGDVVVKQGEVSGTRWISSVCMRICADHPGIAKEIPSKGSVLIIGAPGSGKTTLLRDMIRMRSDSGGGSISVIDERGEIFPVNQDKFCFFPGKCTDVLSGCPKDWGIDVAIRCLGPSAIAVDEITANRDCQALIHAGWCGVDVIATAHAASKEELYTRPVYKPLLEKCLFRYLVILKMDKSYHTERMI